MELEYWASNSLTKHGFISGYQDLCNNVKEIVSLGKREQKLLKKLINYRNTTAQASYFRKVLLDEFLLDVIPPSLFSKKYDIRLQWPKVKTNDEMIHLKFPKERLKLDSECKRLFFWLANLPPPQLRYNSIPPHEGEIKKIECYKIEPELLYNHPNRKIRVKSFKTMPNLLNSRFKDTLQENISETVPFTFKNKFDLKPRVHAITLLKEYILDIFKGSQTEKKPYDLRQWPTPNVHENENTFELIWSQLFDLEFNKLEFLKITTNYPSNKIKTNNRMLKKGWKIPKSELKQLDWNPFKQINEITAAEIISTEKLPEHILRPPKYEIKHQELSYSSFDLINMERNLVESINFIPMSRSTRTTVEEPTTASAPDDTISSNENNDLSDTSMAPQKRSFIDDDLVSILHFKKKHRKSDDNETSKISHEATMFCLLNQESSKHNILRQSPPLLNVEQPLTPEIPYKPIEEPREILLNATKIKENLKIIRYLNNETNLKIFEQNLSSRCDFVISSTSCIIILKLDLFFQLQTDKTLFYENILKSLLTEFKNVVILMKYSEILDGADPDAFWKIKLYLQPPEFQVFMSQDDPEKLAQWVDVLSKKAPPINDVQQFDPHPLILLNINKFLVHELLSNYTLEQLLLKARSGCESELLKWLTVAQLKRIKKLMALGW